MPYKKTKDFNFEESLDHLSTLIEQMERGNLPLEESLKNFEKGVWLIRKCQKALETAEQKVKILINQSGREMLMPFKPEPKNDDSLKYEK